MSEFGDFSRKVEEEMKPSGNASACQAVGTLYGMFHRRKLVVNESYLKSTWDAAWDRNLHSVSQWHGRVDYASAWIFSVLRRRSEYKLLSTPPLCISSELLLVYFLSLVFHD